TRGACDNLGGKTATHIYDAGGRMTVKVDRNGVLTTYIYDIHRRLINQKTGQIQISYTYNGNENQLDRSNIRHRLKDVI
ncbi:MAG TPA: hypothetical protein DC000_01320, partial [Clostridiales bacterium]|nr:hypothetical protein [Clostridiales bacterium]